MTAPALHLSERSEVRDNSTPRSAGACPGALLITDPSGRRRLVPAHRGARSCPDAECRGRYRRRLFALARSGIREGLADGVLFVKLLTLTAPEPIAVTSEFVHHGWKYRGPLSGETETVGPTTEHAYRYMAQRFNRFQTSARRRWDYAYFRVVEEGSRKPYRDERGRRRMSEPRVHYHLLVMCRRFMDQGELSRLAEAAGLGEVVHITAALSEDDVSRYVTKYATKTGGGQVPRGLRFYVMSQNWAARSRASFKLRAQMEKDARHAEGWRFEYIHEKDVATVAAIVEATPTAERVEIPGSWLDAVDSHQLELEAAA